MDSPSICRWIQVWSCAVKSISQLERKIHGLDAINLISQCPVRMLALESFGSFPWEGGTLALLYRNLKKKRANKNNNAPVNYFLLWENTNKVNHITWWLGIITCFHLKFIFGKVMIIWMDGMIFEIPYLYSSYWNTTLECSINDIQYINIHNSFWFFLTTSS